MYIKWLGDGVAMLLTGNSTRMWFGAVVVVAKWLELWPRNLEVPSTNPPGAQGFFLFFLQWWTILTLVPQERCILTGFFPMKIALAVLPEAKQA